jgi:acetyl-CoA carboxylase carboxyltransferase component
MNEFVTQCGRDRVPIIWFQDTSGIDVGDIAEKAELLGLGQALIYSIQQTDLPMMLVLLRKGTAAAHYIMGGPTANRHNAFTLGTPTTEIYVMHGETAAAASFSRRLVKEQALFQADLLRPAWSGGRSRQNDRYSAIPGSFCRSGISKSQIHLPAASDDAAQDH